MICDIDWGWADNATTSYCQSNKATAGPQFNTAQKISQPFQLRTLTVMTDMVLSARSVRCRRRKYLARTIPAGHSLPPHPSERSSLRRKGSLKKPSKEILLCPIPCGSLTGTKDSLTSKGAKSDNAGLGSRPPMHETVMGREKKKEAGD